MELDTIKTILYFVSMKEINASVVEKMFPQTAVDTLKHMGLIERDGIKYRLTADTDLIAKEIYELCKKEKNEPLYVPFVSKIFKSKNAYSMPIPAYICKSFDIQHGDLLVVEIAEVPVSGIVSGEKKLFYIRKKFWNKLNVEPGEEVVCVLLRVFKRRDSVAEESNQVIS